MITRRIFYVSILVHIDSHPTYQLSMLMACSTLMMIVLLRMKPFENPDNLALQFFNELNVLLITGIMFGFT